MINLYRDYMQERNRADCYECDLAFCLYRLEQSERFGRVFHIVDLYVDPEVRGRGEALGIMKQMVVMAKGSECDMIGAQIDRQAENHKDVLRLALKFGFEATMAERWIFLTLKLRGEVANGQH